QLTSVASRRDWVYASGVGELACAAALAVPRTRRAGGYASAALFVGVFPGNIQIAVDYRRRGRPGWQQAIAYGRLPLQVPLVLAALRAARRRPGHPWTPSTDQAPPRQSSSSAGAPSASTCARAARSAAAGSHQCSSTGHG